MVALKFGFVINYNLSKVFVNTTPVKNGQLPDGERPNDLGIVWNAHAGQNAIFCSSTRDLAGIVPIVGFIAVRIENMP